MWYGNRRVFSNSFGLKSKQEVVYHNIKKKDTGIVEIILQMPLIFVDIITIFYYYYMKTARMVIDEKNL